MSKEITIVVGCVDKYAMAWPMMKHGLEKYWKDRNWDIVFITNEKGFYDYPTIKVGPDESWSKTIRKGLEQVDSEFILWMMEDYWLTGPVDNKALNDMLDIMKKDKLDHIRILAPANAEGTIIPEMELECPYENAPEELGLWYFTPIAEYRASLATSIWRKEVIMKCLVDGTTPWQFEADAGVASRGNNKHLCTIRTDVVSWPWRTNPHNDCLSSPIRKGMWTEAAYKYVDYEGLDEDLSLWPNGARVSNNIRARVRDWMYIGKDTIIDDFSYFSVRMEIGKKCHIASGVSIAGGRDMLFKMGDYCSISSGVKIWCASNDFVNDLVVIDHPKDGWRDCRGDVHVGNYCAIGTNTVIMPGVRIPEGTVIGGMSWVPFKFPLEPWSVYAGIGKNFKKIKDRNKEKVLNQVKRLEENE